MTKDQNISSLRLEGLGVDVVFISEFENLVLDPDSVFLQKHFTAAEIRYCENAPGRFSEHLAVRFAAKEALLKSLESSRLFRTSFLEKFDFCEVEVCHDPFGRPYLHFSGKLQDVMTTKNYQTLLSLSHDGDYALAEVFVQKKV